MHERRCAASGVPPCEGASTEVHRQVVTADGAGDEHVIRRIGQKTHHSIGTKGLGIHLRECSRDGYGMIAAHKAAWQDHCQPARFGRL